MFWIQIYPMGNNKFYQCLWSGVSTLFLFLVLLIESLHVEDLH